MFIYVWEKAQRVNGRMMKLKLEWRGKRGCVEDYVGVNDEIVME